MVASQVTVTSARAHENRRGARRFRRKSAFEECDGAATDFRAALRGASTRTARHLADRKNGPQKRAANLSLDARRFFGALLGAACAAALLLLLWLAGARLDQRFRAPREYSLSRRAKKRAAAPRRATAQTATAKRVAASANRARAAAKTSSTLAASTSAGAATRPRAATPWRALLSDATTRGALLIWLMLLAALLPLLRRPPPILWRVLSSTPAWGWMLLGGVLAAALLFAQGVVAFTMLTGTLFCAFVFVWLEGV